MRGVRRQAHILLPAGDHDRGGAGGDLLGAERDRSKARAAHLVYAQGGRLHRNARGDRRLPRRILPLARGQDLAHDDLVHLGWLDARPLQRGPDGHLAQRMGGHPGKSAVERADWRTRRADDDDGFLFHTDLHFPKGFSLLP